MPRRRSCSPIRSWGLGCYLRTRHSPVPVRVRPDQQGLGLRGFLDDLPMRAALHTARAIEVVEVAANGVAHQAHAVAVEVRRLVALADADAVLLTHQRGQARLVP